VPETHHACFQEETTGREVCILTDRDPQAIPLQRLIQTAANMFRVAAHHLRLTRTGPGRPNEG